MFTKGPWRVEKESHAIVGKRKSSDLPLCIGELFVPVDNGLDWEMFEDNARLIEGALDLLKHCKRLTERLEEATKYVAALGKSDHNAGMWDSAVKEARAAISKVEGEVEGGR